MKFIKESTVVEKMAVILVLAQLIFKVVLEIRKAFEATLILVPIMSIVFTILWGIVIYLCLTRRKTGYLLGGIVGLTHIILTMPLPFFMKVCDHYLLAILVSSHGLLIGVFCIWSYLQLKKERNNV